MARGGRHSEFSLVSTLLRVARVSVWARHPFYFYGFSARLYILHILSGICFFAMFFFPFFLTFLPCFCFQCSRWSFVTALLVNAEDRSINMKNTNTWETLHSNGRTRSLPYFTRKAIRRSAETTAASRSCHAGKVLFKVVARRLRDYCGTKGLLSEEQCGFRPGRSTTDMMLVVRRLQEIGRKAGVSIFMCFIDLQKTYDTVARTLPW